MPGDEPQQILMTQQKLLLFLGLGLVLCLVLPAQAYLVPNATTGLLDQTGCYLGVYLGGNAYSSGPDSSHETWIPDPAAFTAASGKTHRLFSRYVSLENVLNANENRDGKTTAAWAAGIIADHDAVPVIFLVPWDSGLSLSHTYPDGKTAQQHIDLFAEELKPLTEHGDTIMIVFGHEMESQDVAKQNPSAFIAMFQYAAGKFHAAGCQMVWCTNINDNPFTGDQKIQWWPGSENPYHTIIEPGNSSVDWVAQTRYHFWWGANTFTGLKGEYQPHPEQAWYNYFGETLGFPLMFAETAGQKPAPYQPGPYWDPDPHDNTTQEFSTQWIPSLYNAHNLKTNYPLIKAVIWFDTFKYNDNGQPEQNYLIPPGTWNPSKGSVQPLSGPLYTSLISDPYFIGSTSLGDPDPLPVAAFTTDPEAGPAPLLVQFADTSGNDPTSWHWDFGTGSSSALQHPQYIYPVPGVYTVTLTATNTFGNDSTSRDITVTIGPVLPPVAAFGAYPVSGTAPLAVQFTDTSQNAPESWHWDFGDGSTATEQNPVHTYVTPGRYSVNLTVSNRGGSDSLEKSGLVSVDAPVPPLPHSFSGTITINGSPGPVNTTITAQVTGGGGTLVTTEAGTYGGDGARLTVQGWIQDGWPITFFADGIPVECRDVALGGDWVGSYPYTAGSHTPLDLRLTGESPAPVANFTADPTSGPAPLIVQFTDTSLHNPASWSWDFGDGTTSTTQHPVHTYTVPGYYTVNLTATNDAGSTIISREDYIHVRIIIGGDRGYFRIICNEDGAAVWFDQTPKGLTENGTLIVPVYLTTLHYQTYTVAKDGFTTVTGDLPVYPAKDETVDIPVTLHPVPPAGFSFINASTGNVGGIIQPTGLVEVPAGGSQNFTLTPASGYTFDRLLVDGTQVPSVYTYSFQNVTSNHTIVVFFRITGGGGGGGGGGSGGYVVPVATLTTIPTTIPTPVTGEGDNASVPVTPTPDATALPTLVPEETTPVPTTIAPAPSIWSSSPLAWMIPVALLILILAGLAYYSYRKEQETGPDEEK